MVVSLQPFRQHFIWFIEYAFLECYKRLDLIIGCQRLSVFITSLGHYCALNFVKFL